MTHSIQLRNFQWATVRAVCDGLDANNGIYALADEVGLGKTLVCAEAAFQIMARKRCAASGRYIIYYIAPSIELLEQNLKSMRNYLEERAKGSAQVFTSVSRLSCIPLDLANRIDKSSAKKIHVIGLSPGTSFTLTGQGRKQERAFLAALLGFRKGAVFKQAVLDVFWGLKRRIEPGSQFLADYELYSHAEKLGVLAEKLDTLAERSAAIYALAGGSDKDKRSLVAAVRHDVSSLILDEIHPDLVICDEWHRYRQVCLKNALMKRFMDRLRRSGRSKMLFVSATPFAVDMQEEQLEIETHASEDLRGLLEMMWGENDYREHHDLLLGKQRAYLKAMVALIGEGDGRDAAAVAARKAYEAQLRRYCVRTERPRLVLAHGNWKARRGDWQSVFETHALRRFLDAFGKAQPVRTPVTAMWLDGHEFPRYGYDGLKDYDGPRLRGTHWKTTRLIEHLSRNYALRDGLHDFCHPPLWVSPQMQKKDLKHLIFTNFKFVPDEVCGALTAAKMGAQGKGSGSVLGVFPVLSKTHRAQTQQAGLDSVHFALFYPFLAFEPPVGEMDAILAARREAIAHMIHSSEDAVVTVRDLDMVLAPPGCEKRAERRGRILDFGAAIPATPRFKEYLHAIFIDRKIATWPGLCLARLAGSMWQRMAREYADDAKALKNFEQHVLGLGNSFLRLFASLEAQRLARRARFRRPPGVDRRWNRFVRFAIWYVEQFRLQETLGEFAQLLTDAGNSPQAVLAEIVAAQSLRKGQRQNRYARSFHDRKANAREHDGELAPTSKSIRAAFNSPFPPYVLVSTSVGQEGLDFHRYCASVIHWSPPSSPSVLRQREGRVDRYNALQIRRALSTCDMEATRSDDGMSPDFVVIVDGERLNHARPEVWYLPYTAEEAAWKRCLNRMYYNDLLIGAPDPLADERLVLNAVAPLTEVEQQRRLTLAQKHAVSLKPERLTPDGLRRLGQARLR